MIGLAFEHVVAVELISVGRRLLLRDPQPPRSPQIREGAKYFIGAMETLEADAGFTAPIPPGMDGT